MWDVIEGEQSFATFKYAFWDIDFKLVILRNKKFRKNF